MPDLKFIANIPSKHVDKSDIDVFTNDNWKFLDIPQN